MSADTAQFLAGDASGDDLMEAGSTEQQAHAAPIGGGRARGALAVVVLVATALAAVTMLASRTSSTVVGRHVGKGLVLLQAESGEDEAGEDGGEGDGGACAQLEGECTKSQCCANGGDKGYQCYAKNDGWAQCMESCEEGVHEDETDGEWDQYGNFQKLQWSCEKLGERSLPSCASFTSKKSCDADRCDWNGKACTERCSLSTSEGECTSDLCMWDGECKNACETFLDAGECDYDRCDWKDDKCIKACWKFSDPDSCDETRCIWGDDGCQVDPCSAPGEDCSETKCCSQERGGAGMTCFQKSKNWASCNEECPKEDDDGKWSCKALGNRTGYKMECSWGGDDCSKTRCCANDGYTCIKKDDLFSGCQQTTAKTTWVTKDVEIPADWDGEVLGYGHGDTECAQSDGEVAGTTLYCFAAALPDSYEFALMDIAKKRKTHLYGCDAYDLFESRQSGSAGWDTGEATLVNTDVFIEIFEKVNQAGTFKKHDWTIKADADCVFVPQRVRDHISSFNPPANTAMYVKNNGMDPDLGNHGFLGAIEIFSRRAMLVYFDNAKGCEKFFGLGCGEDGFFKGCFDALGACFIPDYEMFMPGNHAGQCVQENKGAFHPIKDPDEWEECVDLIEGKAAWQQQGE